MISKEKQKFFRSLQIKKYRDEHGLFVAEGEKVVQDLIGLFEPAYFIFNPLSFDISGFRLACPIFEATEKEIASISALKTPRPVIAVFRRKTNLPNFEKIDASLSLVLDGIQDPGNLGTIIRLAAWFGISTILCSPDSTDVYNPKVIQATMGALARVDIFYLPIDEWLAKSKASVFGTFLNGENIYSLSLPSQGYIVMGNEGNGISGNIEKLVTQRLFIPSYPGGNQNIESLNVATATAIVLSEFRRGCK